MQTDAELFVLFNMNQNVIALTQIANKKTKLIIGLMSGTSLDGLDIALCRFTGNGLNTTIELVNFSTIIYNTDFKEEIMSVFAKRNVDLEKVCLLNAWIGKQHAQMINDCLHKWGVENKEVDLIASHGQTIYHAPKILHQQQQFGNATLQIGDGDHIAVKTGIITLSDFRQKHVAAGGEGAPLAVYGDFLIFGKQGENRVMLNIGGIANYTYLCGDMDSTKVFSTDTGPGNTLMDAYIKKHFEGKYFDENATIALQGNIEPNLLNKLKENSFFEQNFPKTTGPELFNLHYLTIAQEQSNTQHLSHFDIMATLNKFSAETIAQAIQRGIKEENFCIYTSGGGMHNPLLMQHLKELLPNQIFKSTADLQINPDAKEAVLFAILANECICGNNNSFLTGSNGIPNVSMGKISFPN